MDYSRLSKQELIEILVQTNGEKVKDPGCAMNEIRAFKMDFSQENVILLVLDNANHVLRKKLVFKGGLSESIIDLKIILNIALRTRKSRGIIVAHNHPSGSLTPSREDIEFTTRCRDACKLVGLQLVDSIIFTETGSRSLREDNFI